MGDNADDCYEQVLREMEDMDFESPFYGCGPEPAFVRPTRSRSNFHNVQAVGRVSRQLSIPLEEKQDYKFIAVDRTWPFRSRDCLVQAVGLEAAMKEFFENEYHEPFHETRTVPFLSDVQIAPGGWILYGDTTTILVFLR